MRSMTKTELKENWEAVLEKLAQSMERLKVETFFRPLEPFKLSEKEKKLYLVCVSGEAFFKGRAGRYKTELDDAIRDVFGAPYKIEILDKEPDEKTVVPGLVFEDDNHPNPNYTFDSFVAGPNNRLAFAACVAVADGYSKKYNPLFLYGGSGLGKTHLMHAIWQYVRLNNPKKKVLYVSSETFTNELIYAIQTKTQSKFREKYRSVDYLLFDDVQFIQGKESTEEELFNTFDTIHRTGKQIIFSSDRAPKDLGDIPERLSSRFSWGLIADIQPPDYETRVAILKNKAILNDLVLDDDLMIVIDVIAQNIQANIRELEGAFTRVVAYAALTGEAHSKDLTRKVLSDIFDTQQKILTPALIKKTVANYFGVKISELESPKRTRSIAFPRQVAIYLIRENTDCSLPKIGDFFGGRDHTTILHSYEKIKGEIGISQEVKNTVETLTKILND